ncbi:hypothetical protein ENSA5_26370 [Enhygromyxa salina]|uniref:Uncharacterized protein n=1 Tax=Enhygromyxa salina TaxID=215803 RepID=A0A2S9YAN5_9BACT|nr:hypothetical protein [Enhygromyxa salina]PRQ02178.1 hypothetical protein ENSA5_26370 [Enhygromyxa salina]
MARNEHERAFAIVRLDDFQGQEVDLRNRVTVKRIVWSEEEAEREVERLNELHDDVRYFWQATRVDRRAPS